jgi:hypothetical protein
MTETDPQQVLFELREVAELLRQDRAVEVRLYTGHPREEEVREAVGALCLA